MDPQTALNFEFSSDWNVLKDLREQLHSRLIGDLEKWSEPVIMTSMELVENAIKYGESDFSFFLDVDAEHIHIRVSNTVGKDGNYEQLADIVQKIQASHDPFELYMERLQELMSGPPSGSVRIGLIRIAYEGKCELRCEIKDGRVQICAKRKME